MSSNKSTGLKRNTIDKFYTSPDTVQTCIQCIKDTIAIQPGDLCIEPSAGNGAFIPEIKLLSNHSMFYDLEPGHDEIKKQDYLTLEHDVINGQKIHIIGNPPFGRQSSLAIRFIKKSAIFCDSICFILPKSFKKDSLKKAGVGTLALLETHYSNRLGGDVNQTFLHKQKEWIEIARYTTPKQNFILSAYEKVNGVDEYEKVHFKFIEATDSSNPTSFYCLGNTYLTKLKNLEKAYNAFGKSVQIDSTYAEGFLGLGKTMILKRNYKSAILFFNKGLGTVIISLMAIPLDKPSIKRVQVR